VVQTCITFEVRARPSIDTLLPSELSVFLALRRAIGELSRRYTGTRACSVALGLPSMARVDRHIGYRRNGHASHATARAMPRSLCRTFHHLSAAIASNSGMAIDATGDWRRNWASADTRRSCSPHPLPRSRVARIYHTRRSQNYHFRCGFCCIAPGRLRRGVLIVRWGGSVPVLLYAPESTSLFCLYAEVRRAKTGLRVLG
jgi:hypothetical protein